MEIDQKAHNTSISRLPVTCIVKILATFNFYSGRPRVGLSVNSKQKVRQAMIKISRGRGGGVKRIPFGHICYPKWLDHRRVNSFIRAVVVVGGGGAVDKSALMGK